MAFCCYLYAFGETQMTDKQTLEWAKPQTIEDAVEYLRKRLILGNPIHEEIFQKGYDAGYKEAEYEAKQQPTDDKVGRVAKRIYSVFKNTQDAYVGSYSEKHVTIDGDFVLTDIAKAAIAAMNHKD